MGTILIVVGSRLSRGDGDGGLGGVPGTVPMIFLESRLPGISAPHHPGDAANGDDRLPS